MEIKKKVSKDKKAKAKQLLHTLHVVYCMLRNTMSNHNLDLRLLLERGKSAGRRIFSLHHWLDCLPCRSMDSAKSYYSPREVEFSCSNSPSNPSNMQLRANKRRSQNRSLKMEAVASAFQILDMLEISHVGDDFVAPMPSPIAPWRYLKSPAVVRQIRVTDSPFPVRSEEEEGKDGRQVDREAEEFITRFYQQLRLQQHNLG